MLVAGVSVRAMADSAARAGFAVTAIDAFDDADADDLLAVEHHALRDRYSARAAASLSRLIECHTVAYASNFENHPRAVSTLAAQRTLWGNPPAVLRQVRNPAIVARRLVQRGCHAAAVVTGGLPPADGRDQRWLVKPLASGGGRLVQEWLGHAPMPRHSYLQQLVEGVPGSVVFVAAGGTAVALGVSRQLVGDSAFGASGYQYCGNILATAGDGQFPDDEGLMAAATALTGAVAHAFQVVGVNNIDFIAGEKAVHAIEINPRWSASMELVEGAYGLSVFGAHAHACAQGGLPDFNLPRARQDGGAVGKAVVFARRDIIVGNTREWLADASVRDVPRAGELIAAGRPVCTVFATGHDSATCYAGLVQRAERVYEVIAEWTSDALRP